MSGWEHSLAEEIAFLEQYRERVIRVMDRPLSVHPAHRRTVSRRKVIETFLKTKSFPQTARLMDTSPAMIHSIMRRAFLVAKCMAGVWPPAGREYLNDARDRILAMERDDDEDEG